MSDVTIPNSRFYKKSKGVFIKSLQNKGEFLVIKSKNNTLNGNKRDCFTKKCNIMPYTY